MANFFKSPYHLHRPVSFVFYKTKSGTCVKVCAKYFCNVTFSRFLLLISKIATMAKRYFFLLPFVFIAACKSPGKAYNQGNYTDAIELSVRKLQKDPYDAESKQILQNAYSFAVHQYQEKIQNLSELSSDNRWEQLYFQYSQLQHLYDKI